MTEMYLNGVSTRKVTNIVEELCGHSISRSHVSQLAAELDNKLNIWCKRKLNKTYPYLVIDARYERIRTQEGVVPKAVMIVIGISEDGNREILSIDIGDSENETDWGHIFKTLKERGLKGVHFVVSDDHKGLVKALQRNFQGALWQRCQVHFMRNFITKMSRRKAKLYIPLLKDIFAATSKDDAIIRKDRLLDKLENEKPEVARWLDEEIESCFSVYNLPETHHRRMKSTNMIERLNQELKRRSRVIRIFPNDASCLRVLGTLCMEQSEVWESGRMYLTMTTSDENAAHEFAKAV